MQVVIARAGRARFDAITLRSKNQVTGERPMAEKMSEIISNSEYAVTVAGLARMEDHIGTFDEVIEKSCLALFDSWPIEEALSELYELAPQLKSVFADTDPTETQTAYTLAILAGRMFVAGRESARKRRS
jgi:hypothetical protein